MMMHGDKIMDVFYLRIAMAIKGYSFTNKKRSENTTEYLHQKPHFYGKLAVFKFSRFQSPKSIH